MRAWPILVLAVALAGCARTDVPAAPVQAPGFALQALPGSFDSPVFLTHDPAGTLYVVEQAGAIERLDPSGYPSRFLDLSVEVASGGERGMLGLAFHPQYATNGRLFVHYTDIDGDTTVSELHATTGVVDPQSERVLLHVDQPYANHNGGMLVFGPDGKLYLGLGDGGSANDPGNRAQSLDSLLGKILRVDVDAAPAPVPYTIPPDNPFATRTTGAEVWDYGLRNPWRFSFDRGAADGTGRGDLWIGDVGQDHYEEVDHEPAGSKGGANYGWSHYEGRHIDVADRTAPDAVMPVAEYDHDGRHCSVTGGYVYRGAAIPSLQGAYVFADYCSGYLWTLRANGTAGYAMAQVMDTDHAISSFGEDAAGELYVVDHAGSVLKLVPSASPAASP